MGGTYLQHQALHNGTFMFHRVYWLPGMIVFAWVLLSLALYLFGIYFAVQLGSGPVVVVAFVPLIGQLLLVWLAFSAAAGTLIVSYYLFLFLAWIGLLRVIVGGYDHYTRTSS